MDDAIGQRIIDELERIRKMLTILSQDKLEGFNETIKTQYLSSEQRQQMYEMFDGSNSLQEIAKAVGFTGEGVRKFAVKLEQAGLVEFVPSGRTRNPKRIF